QRLRGSATRRRRANRRGVGQEPGGGSGSVNGLISADRTALVPTGAPMDTRSRESLRPELDDLTEQLETAREEICDVSHVSELDTGEMIRMEETLAIAAEKAKQVVSIRRKIRLGQDEEGQEGGTVRQ